MKDQIYVHCGYAVPPAMTDTNVDKLLSRPIRACASSVRATIKVTSFQYNGTGGAPSLDGLNVVGVESKSYSSEAEKPVWGIENPGQGWNISEIQLLWGLIDGNKFHAGEQLWVIQSESLYLPAFLSDYSRRVGFGFGDAMDCEDNFFLYIGHTRQKNNIIFRPHLVDLGRSLTLFMASTTSASAEWIIAVKLTANATAVAESVILCGNHGEDPLRHAHVYCLAHSGVSLTNCRLA